MFNRNVPLHFAKTGINQQVATFPWLSSDFADVVSFQTPGGKLGVGFGPFGQPWYDNFGNTFSLGISSGATAFGNCLQWLAGAAAQQTTENGAGTIRSLIPTAAVTPKTPTDVGNFVFDATLALDTDRLKLIKSQPTTTSIFISLLDPKYSNLQADQDAYSVAPANADALTFIRPYEFGLFPTANATTGLVAGISLGTTADKDPFFRQTGGLAMVNSKGDVTALVSNAPVVPDGVTAGSVKGSAATSASQVGIATAPYAQATGKSSPIWLTLINV
jgi:hypothetical protein